MNSALMIHRLARRDEATDAGKAALANFMEHFPAMEGPWLIGVTVQLFLLGIVIVQAYDYFQFYSSDSKKMKTLVAFVVFLSILMSTMDTAALYVALIQNFGNYVALLTTTTIYFYFTLWLAPVIAMIVQSFFAYRSYMVSRSLVLAAIMALLITVTAVAGLGVSIIAFTVATDLTKTEALLVWVQVSCWGAASCDLFISIVFAYQMANTSKGFSRSTDHVLSKLLRMALGTAAVTTIMAIANALAFLLNNKTAGYYIIFSLSVPKAYVICFLYVLNSRQGLRLQAEGTTMEGRSTRPQFSFTPKPYGEGSTVGATSGIAVAFQKSVVYDDADTDIVEMEPVRQKTKEAVGRSFLV